MYSQLKSGGPVCSPVLHLADCAYLGRSWLIHLLNIFQVFVMAVFWLSLAFEFVSFLEDPASGGSLLAKTT